MSEARLKQLFLAEMALKGNQLAYIVIIEQASIAD